MAPRGHRSPEEKSKGTQRTQATQGGCDTPLSSPASLQSLAIAGSGCQPLAPAPDPDFAEIKALAATLHDLHRQMAAVYTPVVQDILQRRSQDVQEIEHTLDHLLDCACIPEGLDLFKSLCRYYYGIDPAATADYVRYYREMWDSEEDPEQKSSRSGSQTVTIKKKTPAPICRKDRGRDSGVNATSVPQPAGGLQT